MCSKSLKTQNISEVRLNALKTVIKNKVKINNIFSLIIILKFSLYSSECFDVSAGCLSSINFICPINLLGPLKLAVPAVCTEERHLVAEPKSQCTFGI